MCAIAQDYCQAQALVLSLGVVLPALIAQTIKGLPGECPVDLDCCSSDFNDVILRAHVFRDVCALQGGLLTNYTEDALATFMERLQRLDSLPFETVIVPELRAVTQLCKFIKTPHPPDHDPKETPPDAVIFRPIKL